MSPRLLLPLLVAACLGCAGASAPAKKSSGTIIRNPAPRPEPVAVAAPDADLTSYYVGLISKGANFEAYDQEDRAKIQSAHMQNMERLAGLGKLLVAGPFSDNGEWRGLFIFKCGSLAEAQELAATDPAVKTGRFKIEVHPWLTEKGAIRDPEFSAVK